MTEARFYLFVRMFADCFHEPLKVNTEILFAIRPRVHSAVMRVEGLGGKMELLVYLASPDHVSAAIGKDSTDITDDGRRNKLVQLIHHMLALQGIDRGLQRIGG